MEDLNLKLETDVNPESKILETGNLFVANAGVEDTSYNELRTDDESPFTTIHQQSDQMLEDVARVEAKTKEFLSRQVQGEDISQRTIEENIESLRQSRTKLGLATYRIFKLEDEMSHVTKELKRSERKRRFVPFAPANAYVDWLENEQLSFARGFNYYKRFLVFFLGCFVGVVVEMLWCYLRHGYFESRAGLVYGPFNPLYGVGALLVTQALYKLRNRSPILIFLGGALVTSLVEYIASWGQEFVYGTRSWDYSGFPLNINGRITLLYSIFWGLLSVLWIKDLYPRLSKALLNLPERTGRYITHILAIFMVFNMVISGMALARWVQREHDQYPISRISKILDDVFPDERMERIYPNMVSFDSD